MANYRMIAGIFLVWLGLLLGVGFLTQRAALPVYGGSTCALRHQLPFYRWDSFWYTSIARHGYTFSEEKNSSIAFFPFYPAVLRVMHDLTNVRLDRLSFGLNITFSFLAAFFLYRLARIDYSEWESRVIVTVFLFFPPTYFFLSGYPDVLFALLAILSLYAARHKRWVWAGLVAGLLALTKPYGILMCPVLLLEYLWSENWDIRIWWKRWDWLPLLFPLAAFSGFILFNYERFSQPFAFLRAQHTWGRSLDNPLVALMTEARYYLTSDNVLAGSNFPYLIYVASFVFSIIALRLSWARVRKTYLLFSILLLLSALLTGTLTSWGRYMLLGFPILMGPALFLSPRRRLLVAYLLFSAASLVFLASLFVRCYPVE